MGWYSGEMIRVSWLVALVACSSSPAKKDASQPGSDGNSGAEIPHGMPGNPGIGGHALAFDRFNSQHAGTISTPGFTTAATGSTMIVSVGRGQAGVFDQTGRTPTDNKGNAPYQLLGSEEPYTLYPSSSTGAFAFPSMTGGDGTIVTTKVPTTDEITIMRRGDHGRDARAAAVERAAIRTAQEQ